MEWLKNFTMARGEHQRIESLLGNIDLERQDHVLHYTRQRFTEDTEDSLSKTFVVEDGTAPLRMSFLPVYPDRPVIFKPVDPLVIPPGEAGFFCMTVTMGIGVTIKKTSTLLEELLAEPRKNSYWGPPNNGVLAYQVRSPTYTDPVFLAENTDLLTAVVPIHFKNQREEGDEVERCLVPLEELDLYRNDAGDLIFEVVSLTQSDEFYQEPQPIKRPPREMMQVVKRFMNAPSAAQSLFEKVKSLPRLDHLTNVFMNR